MIRKEEKQEIIQNNAQHEGDTGSPEVQIAILTKRIADLTESISKHIRRTITAAAACCAWLVKEGTCSTTWPRRTSTATAI